MGSPVSAVVANLYMEQFEWISLNTALVKPRIWQRYVYDTHCIVRKGEVDKLLDHLNSVRPSIQFVMTVYCVVVYSCMLLKGFICGHHIVCVN